MQNIKRRIAARVAPLCGRGEQDIAAMLEYPPEDKLGDLSLPCFKLSSTMHKAPPLIASLLSEAFGEEACREIGLERVETVGGYLNFRIDPQYYAEQLLPEILEKGEHFCSIDIGN